MCTASIYVCIYNYLQLGWSTLSSIHGQAFVHFKPHLFSDIGCTGSPFFGCKIGWTMEGRLLTTKTSAQIHTCLYITLYTRVYVHNEFPTVQQAKGSVWGWSVRIRRKTPDFRRTTGAAVFSSLINEHPPRCFTYIARIFWPTLRSSPHHALLFSCMYLYARCF